MSTTNKHALGERLANHLFKEGGKDFVIIYDEAHTLLQLPFEDINTALDLIAPVLVAPQIMLFSLCKSCTTKI